MMSSFTDHTTTHRGRYIKGKTILFLTGKPHIHRDSRPGYYY